MSCFAALRGETHDVMRDADCTLHRAPLMTETNDVLDKAIKFNAPAEVSRAKGPIKSVFRLKSSFVWK